MPPRLLQHERPPHGRLGRALPPRQRRRGRNHHHIRKLDALDVRGELGLDRLPQRRLAGTAGTRDQEQHVKDYRNASTPYRAARASAAVTASVSARMASPANLSAASERSAAVALPVPQASWTTTGT